MLHSTTRAIFFSKVLPELTFWFCLQLLSYLIETSSLLSKYLFTVSLLLFPFVTFSILPPAPPPQRDKGFWSNVCKILKFMYLQSFLTYVRSTFLVFFSSFSVLYLICKELWKYIWLSAATSFGQQFSLGPIFAFH